MWKISEFRRLLPFVLAFVLLTQLFPQAAYAEENGNEDVSREDMISVVEPQIRAYAASINQDDAAANAAVDLAVHGLRGNGKPMTMGSSGSLTAALLNSEVVQKGFAVVFADVIQSMQRLDMQAVPGVQMSFQWYGAENSYSGYVLSGATEYPDNLDWMVTSEQFTGTLNSYDDSLEWMVGGCEADALVECIEDGGSVKTYKVTATFRDRFDFSTANSSGFKNLLSGLGMLLFREFDWSCTVTLNITIPYSYDRCNHCSGAYHWVYDGENQAVISDGDGIYLRNDAAHRTKTADDGTVRHYYELDSAIRLYHNKPWVIEYDVCAPGKIVFAPVDNAVTKTYPQIVQSAGTSLFAVSKDYAMAQNSNGRMDRYYAYNYYGTKLRELFPYANDKTYTLRLENLIAEDGSNGIYLTVIEMDTGNCCLNQVPLNDYYYYGGWMENTVLISEESDWLSGKDIYINYIGTGIEGFSAKTFDLRIWEDGPGNSSVSYWNESAYPSSCTEAGYKVRTCLLCGVSEQMGELPASGHNYVLTESLNSGCDTEGVKTLICTNCGDTQTETEPSLGHIWKEATCLTAKTCDRCGLQEGKPIAHSFGPWQIRQQPACMTDGLRFRACACGEEETEALAALEHQFVNGSCVLCGGEDPEYVLGDVTGDQKADFNDALLVLRASIGLEVLENPAKADMNGDGQADFNDALIILRISIGL